MPDSDFSLKLSVKVFKVSGILKVNEGSTQYLYTEGSLEFTKAKWQHQGGIFPTKVNRFQKGPFCQD